MSETLPHEMTGPVAAVRRFSRFYTRQLGLLDEGLLNSALSGSDGGELWCEPFPKIPRLIHNQPLRGPHLAKPV